MRSFFRMQNDWFGQNRVMFWLILLFVILLLLLILSMPLIVEVRMRIGVRGAAARAKIWLLGLIPIPVRLRVHLLSDPYFTLIFGKKRIFLLQKKKSGGGAGIREGVRVLRLDTKTTVGIEDEPAQAVVAAGTIAVLLSMLIPRVAESGSARASLSKTSMLRIRAEGTLLLNPVRMAAGFWRERRIAKQKDANNSPEFKEKRTEYASC